MEGALNRTLLCFATLVGYFQINAQHAQLENSSPKIIINSPSGQNIFKWGSMVRYSIQVVDHEDGNSLYDEIPSNKVSVIVKYLADSLQLKRYVLNKSNTYPQPLHWMLNSTCFNCHSSKSKLIGPSYDLIAKRYSDKTTSVEELAKKVIAGTTGAWGDVEMPAHPDLTLVQAQQIVGWILKNGADRHQDYFVGLEGSFKMIEKPKAGGARGVYVITASYTDHGLPEIPNSAKLGQASIVVKISED